MLFLLVLFEEAELFGLLLSRGLLYGSLGCSGEISDSYVNASDSALEESDVGLFLGGLKNEGLFLDGNDLTDDTADSGNLITNLKGITHILRFLISLLLRF